MRSILRLAALCLALSCPLATALPSQPDIASSLSPRSPNTTINTNNTADCTDCTNLGNLHSPLRSHRPPPQRHLRRPHPPAHPRLLHPLQPRHLFLGIPYAQQPINNLRFQRPHPLNQSARPNRAQPNATRSILDSKGSSC
ncbi:related to carboxylesterase/lipase EstA precursor (N-terminal fragment) [Sporisorium scitamineum]|uniref:Related to carboxylesterase/lipase EstA (N-terminal) n=1 Tax=Sporisorium scitamineum TaxID=49012 RepID=A0A127Z515_9BASI|nr:related to carboxylesterase/lipase EstA precursor (N-terminal fragment) [Sporisorium scitamineum]